MRPITRITLCALAAAAMAAPAFAASNYYLKLDNIKDESTARDRNNKGWIELGGFHWDATKPTSGSAVGKAVGNYANDGEEAASGQATGKRRHTLIRARAYADQGSLTVKARLPGCAVGATYPRATLDTPGMRYEMENVMVSSCGTSASGSGLPMEEVSFNYGQIQATPVRSKVQVKGWDPATKKD